MGEADTTKMKLKEKLNNKHNRGHQKLRGSVFSLRPRAKREGKYFTSDMKITNIVIF